MNFHIKTATSDDAPDVAALVTALTMEICQRCNDHSQFENKEALTAQLCARWMDEGVYKALIAYDETRAVGVVTIAESYALYAGGKIGIIQECYVTPERRSARLGEALLKAALSLAQANGWACMELCTPPLPEFARTIDFYAGHDFVPVGGRKMRLRVPGLVADTAQSGGALR